MLLCPSLFFIECFQSVIRSTLRDHRSSSQPGPMNYEEMATDVLHFLGHIPSLPGAASQPSPLPLSTHAGILVRYLCISRSRRSVNLDRPGSKSGATHNSPLRRSQSRHVLILLFFPSPPASKHAHCSRCPACNVSSLPLDERPGPPPDLPHRILDPSAPILF
jgi:hypothetical protein